MTGFTRGTGTADDYVTIAYSSGGENLWTNYYQGPGGFVDQANAIVLDPNGNVFVTGFSQKGSGENVDKDYVTIKYSNSGTPLWTNRYEGTSGKDDIANSIAVDSSGTVFITGKSRSAATLNDFATVAYSNAGTPLWTNFYNGAMNDDDEAIAVAVTSDGIVVVLGDAYGTDGYRFTTIACASDGTGLWTNRFEGFGNFWDQAHGLAVDGNGNIFATGGMPDSLANYDYGTIAYSSAGVALWTNRYGGPDTDMAHAITVDSNGNVVVTGYAIQSATDYDCVTIAYSNAGIPLWTNQYDGLHHNTDKGSSVAVSQDGTVFVTGWANGFGGPDCVTLGYLSAGASMWTNLYNRSGNADDRPAAVVVDGAGNVFVTGHAYGNMGSGDALTIAYSAAGVPLWTNFFDGPLHADDEAYAMALDGSGNLIVAGRSTTATGYDYLTIKYSAAGSPLWTNFYNGPADVNDGIIAVATSADGNVYVTGNSHGSSFDDYLTIAYSATGLGLWTNRYTLLHSDQPKAIAVDTNGNVYVTGYSWTIGSGSSPDILTIAYSPAGATLWTHRYNRGPGVEDVGNAIAVAPNGNIIVTGQSDGDYVTLAYSPTGVGLWTNRYTSIFTDDEANAVAVDASGNIFVTGRSGVYLAYRYVTIKYSAAGVGIWTNSFAGPAAGDNIATAIAVTTNGNVIVTGSCHPYVSSQDFATIAYSNSGTPLWTNFYNGPGGGIDRPAVKSCLAVGADGSVIVTGESDSNSGPDTDTYDFVTIKYVDATTLPAILQCEPSGSQVILRWANPTFGLQAAPAVLGVYTNIPGATSPTTHPITGEQMFFRLKAN